MTFLLLLLFVGVVNALLGWLFLGH